jgi:hypothetical protein
MSANRVKETTATTGTGSFTTSGAVAGFQTFNTANGNETDNEANSFPYWAVNDTDNEWESGIGYMSAATTLVRQQVLDNSAGTLVALSFTTAPTLFSEEGESTNTTRFLGLVDSTIKGFCSNHITRTALSNEEVVNDRMYYMPFVNDYGGTVDAFLLKYAQSYGDFYGVGVYSVLPNKLPGKLLTDAAITVPVGSGYQAVTFTAQTLPAAFYIGYIGSSDGSNTPAPLYLSDQNNGINAWLGITSSFRRVNYYYESIAGATWESGIPATAGTSLTEAQATHPVVFLRAV